MALKPAGEAAAAIKKAYGAEVGGLGFKFPSFARLPTGILTLDIALGGGIPMGAVSLIYGNESCGKTSLALRAAAEFQRRYPDRKVAWIDVEQSWDEDWVKLHGVDPTQVYLYSPTTAEEAADLAKELALSEDIGFLIVDSLAALASIQQIEKSAEQVVVAGAAKPSTTLLRNCGAGIAEHRKAGQLLTVMYINQPRNKIGFVMGNPETLPGPAYQNFQAFLKLRLTGKAVLKEKIAPISIYNDHSAKIVKKKFPCIRQSAEWQMATYPYEAVNSQGKPTGKKVKPLEVNNRTHAAALLEAHGFLHNAGTKAKAEWVLEVTGEVFPTKEAAIDSAMSDYDMLLDFFVDSFLLLYKDEIEMQITTGKPMAS